MSRTAAHDPATWQRLRAYREPYRAAAAALAAVGANVGEMMPLRLGDISDDGTTATVDNQSRTVPPAAAVFLRAQLLHRRIQGATGGELLFANDKGRFPDRALADAMRAMATELGVPVAPLATDRAAIATSGRWRTRWSISVQRLKA